MGLTHPLFLLPVVLTLVFGQFKPGPNACRNNQDCPSDRICAQFNCVNPCLLNVCENPVNCKVTNHIPMCSTKECVCGPAKKTGLKKYRVFNNLLTWYKALLHCNAQEMTLATVDSQEEQDRIVGHIKPFGKPKWGFWIGGSDLLEETKFVWSSTGKPVKYTNYYASQPDNYKNANNQTDDCLEIRDEHFDFKWYDEECNYEQRFLCEYYD